MQKLTSDDLGRILRECAGESEKFQWDETVLDTTFDELEYDSIAILEAAARIQQEYGIRVEDESIPDLVTPRAFLDHVNRLPTSPS
ncbi:acyl carrier protein [Nocardiopsis rhodophaea]|uniref:Acyl carrier protein n=1 Tax=Nocardiopsis rhodophaea TaxID=280238 RepID=A0ABN2TIE5_9ACTN